MDSSFDVTRVELFQSFHDGIGKFSDCACTARTGRLVIDKYFVHFDRKSSQLSRVTRYYPVREAVSTLS